MKKNRFSSISRNVTRFEDFFCLKNENFFWKKKKLWSCFAQYFLIFFNTYLIHQLLFIVESRLILILENIQVNNREEIEKKKIHFFKKKNPIKTYSVSLSLILFIYSFNLHFKHINILWIQNSKFFCFVSFRYYYSFFFFFYQNFDVFVISFEIFTNNFFLKVIFCLKWCFSTNEYCFLLLFSIYFQF